MINIDITGTRDDYNVHISMYNFMGDNLIVINYNDEILTSEEYDKDMSYNCLMAVIQKLFYEMIK